MKFLLIRNLQEGKKVKKKYSLFAVILKGSHNGVYHLLSFRGHEKLTKLKLLNRDRDRDKDKTRIIILSYRKIVILSFPFCSYIVDSIYSTNYYPQYDTILNALSKFKK